MPLLPRRRRLRQIEKSKAEKKAERSSSSEKAPDKAKKEQSGEKKSVPGQEQPEKGQEDKLMDELLGEPVRKEGKQQNPSLAKTEKSRLSEPTSGRHSKAEEGTSKSADIKNGGKPSVRQELKEIQERRKAQGERAGLDQNRGERKGKESSSKNQQKSTRHRQTIRKKKTRGKAR